MTGRAASDPAGGLQARVLSSLRDMVLSYGRTSSLTKDTRQQPAGRETGGLLAFLGLEDCLCKAKARIPRRSDKKYYVKF